VYTVSTRVCIVLPTHHITYTTHTTLYNKAAHTTTQHTIRYIPLYTIRYDTARYTVYTQRAVFSHLSVELNPCSQFAVYQ
jgi:hypothetical protein